MLIASNAWLMPIVAEVDVPELVIGEVTAMTPDGP
jgi:hypothetical protein